MKKWILSILIVLALLNTYAFADEIQTNTANELETVDEGIARMRNQNGQFFDALSGLNARSSVVHRLTGVSLDLVSIDDNDFFSATPYIELPFFGERASLVKDYSFFTSFTYLSRNEGDFEYYNLLAGLKGELTDDKFGFYSIVGWNFMIGVIYHEEGQDDYTYPEFNHGWSYFVGTFRFGWEIRWDFSFRFPETGGIMMNYLETMFHFSVGNLDSFFVTMRPGFQLTWLGSMHNDVKSAMQNYRAYFRVGFPEFVVLEPYYQYDSATEKSGIGFKLYLFYSF